MEGLPVTRDISATNKPDPSLAHLPIERVAVKQLLGWKPTAEVVESAVKFLDKAEVTIPNTAAENYAALVLRFLVDNK